MKGLTGHVTALSLRSSREVLSVPLEGGEPVSSLATLYVGLANPTNNTIAVSLVAGLLGQRQPVGTAGIPPGFSGIAVIATGIVADAWHVEAWGELQDGRLDVALGVRQCCSGFSVIVPPGLQDGIPMRVPTIPEPVMPLSRSEGLYTVREDDEGDETIIASERILRVVATANASAVGTVSGLPLGLIHIPPGETREFLPHGNLSGPIVLSFAHTTFYSVEKIR